MATVPSTSARSYHRRARSLRLRAGIARTFGSLFAILAVMLLLPGVIFLHDALTNPLTADVGQVLMGSSCVAFSMLLAFFLVREMR
ncbi:MAG TPA: hypothetical protein VGF20_03005 [Candidatus Acidoferrum sp.]|jgi:hypothetical protein